MIAVNSSAIRAVGYDGSTLTVEFHSGRIYDHPNVPYHVYLGLMTANSMGRYYKPTHSREVQVNDSPSNHDTAMAEVRRLVAEAKELSGAAGGALSDHLAGWIAGQYAVAVRQLAAENGNGALNWNQLRDLCHDLVDLRRGDHSAESLRMEREQWEAQQQEKKVDQEMLFWQWAQENQEQICKGFKSQAEKIALMRQAYFADLPPDGPLPGAGDENNQPASCPPVNPNSEPSDQGK